MWCDIVVLYLTTLSKTILQVFFEPRYGLHLEIMEIGKNQNNLN